ncbi:MAG: hypothetical protein RL265_1464 [Bacteroidota bacterium]
MQAERTFIDDLKHQYRFGGMTMRLLFINSGIFILIQLFHVFGRLIGGDATKNIAQVAESIFALNTDIPLFLQHPWGLFTSIFAHFTFWHFLMNMLFLYFSGKMFESLFDQKRLLYTYLIGGIAGGLLEILAHLIFPVLQKESIVIVGASGSIMAIFSALAFRFNHGNLFCIGFSPSKSKSEFIWCFSGSTHFCSWILYFNGSFFTWYG